ncbi:MAG: alpha/beta fold hydrolase [Proteobacteria bacterium]|nr:alpha/beta fold hydrolase [Pseudomonadota bacterium]
MNNSKRCISKMSPCALVFMALIVGVANIDAATETATPSPAEVFSTLPPIGHIALSPDGGKAVVLKALADTYHAVVVDLQTGKSKLVMAADPDQFSFNWCRFANQTRVVCSIRKYIRLQAGQVGAGIRWYRDGRFIATRLIAVDVDGANTLQLVKSGITEQGRRLEWNALEQDNVISWLDDDDDHVLIQLARDHRLYPSVYKLNIYTNKLKRVRRHRESVFYWYADQQGVIRNAAGYHRQKQQFRAHAVTDDGLKPIPLKGLDNDVPPQFVGYIKDGASALMIMRNGLDKQALYEVSTSDGRVLDTIFADAEDRFDVTDAPAVNRVGQPVFIPLYRERGMYHWFDKTLEQEYLALKAQLPGSPGRVRIVSASRDWQSIVISTSGNGTLPKLYLYDRRSEKPRLVMLSESYRDAKSEWLSDPQPVTYTARDGLSIPAYLTLPTGVPTKNLPTIVLPHGGPYARDTDRFDSWVQALVARGYAVLQPNFRGSHGYGSKFLRAGFEQWGMSMQDDLDDGLAWLVQQGIADPKRVCIVGGSYGGYAALVAGFKSPEKYQCAVAFAPVTDLDELVKRRRYFVTGALAIARIQSGELRDQYSPLQRVDDFKIPLLLVHGDVDRRVMIEQSQTLARALTKAGKDFRYIEQPNGNHHLSLQSHRREFFLAMDEFLDQHIGRGRE